MCRRSTSTARTPTCFPPCTRAAPSSSDPARHCCFPGPSSTRWRSEGSPTPDSRPSYLRLLLASPQIAKLGDSTLEIIALGGEASSRRRHARAVVDGARIRVFNRYGPTETTIAVTNVELTPEHD